MKAKVYASIRVDTRDTKPVIVPVIALAAQATPGPQEARPVQPYGPYHSYTVPIVEAAEPRGVKLDRARYFVIVPEPTKGVIVVEHYSYDNSLLRVIRGKDARSIYFTIIENGWVTQLSHAAYLGKELTRAELSLQTESRYVQDGA